MAYLNIASNKPAMASGYVKPFEAARAVNGTTAPTSRWLCNSVSSTNPAKLTVSLGGLFIITSWVVKHMGVAGWVSPNYNMSDFKLQGSLDNNTWYDLDSVVSNTVAITNRTITSTTPYRYVRLSVTKGLNTNPQLASAVEFEVYGYTTPLLSSLVVSSGSSPLTFTSPFSPTTYGYMVSNTVPYATSSVNLSAIPQDSTATVKVNGTAIAYGANVPVALNVGSNTITVDVFGNDGQMRQTYTVAITRAAGAYMQSLVLKAPDGTEIPLNFNKDTINYAVTVGYDITSVNVVATSSNGTTNVIVNGQTVPSGQLVTVNNLVVGQNTITASVVDDTKTYTISLTRSSSPYLTSVTVTYINRTTYTIPVQINKGQTQYEVDIPNGITSIAITAVGEDGNVKILVNGNQNLASGQISSYISVNQTAQPIIPIVTTSNQGTGSISYGIKIK